jgi:hypothetical protein
VSCASGKTPSSCCAPFCCPKKTPSSPRWPGFDQRNRPNEARWPFCRRRKTPSDSCSAKFRKQIGPNTARYPSCRSCNHPHHGSHLSWKPITDSCHTRDVFRRNCKDVFLCRRMLSRACNRAWRDEPKTDAEKLKRHEAFWKSHPPEKADELNDVLQINLVRKCAYRFAEFYAANGDPGPSDSAIRRSRESPYSCPYGAASWHYRR